MAQRHELTAEQWAVLEPLLPPQQAATGRPTKDHRTILNGIRWRPKTGAPGRDLPERDGPWQSLYTRFRRWQQTGVWDRVLATLQAEADERGELDWDLHFLDSTTIRAHPHAAGAIKPSAPAGAASAPSSTCAPAEPVTGTLTPGQRHEATHVAPLLDQGAVKQRRGRPRLRPKRVAGDRVYTGCPVRQALRRRRIGAVIPRQRRESRRGVRFDQAAYRERNRVERTINCFKQYWALATRYEKLQETFHAFVTIAAILQWIPV